MKKSVSNSIICLVFLTFLSSCASIIHGSYQSVSFSSQPSGAKITIDGKDYGATPKSVDLRRMGRLKGEPSIKHEYSVKVEIEGYFPYEIKVKREMDGWFLGNLLFGGLIGIIIDASNGAMYKLTPDQVIAQMGKSTSMNTNRMDGNLYIAMTLSPDPSWVKIGSMKRAN